MHTRPFAETSEAWTPNRIIWNALLLEVSLLSAGVRPREPHARVLSVRDEPDVDLRPQRLVRNFGAILGGPLKLEGAGKRLPVQSDGDAASKSDPCLGL
jgi:hypothetical protein